MLLAIFGFPIVAARLTFNNDLLAFFRQGSEALTGLTPHGYVYESSDLLDRDERRFTVRFRRSMGGLAEPGKSEVAADVHNYHRPTQRVGRRNTHSNACYSATGDPRSVAENKSCLDTGKQTRK